MRDIALFRFWMFGNIREREPGEAMILVPRGVCVCVAQVLGLVVGV